MNHHTPSSNRRNLRTFIASLLAYVLVTSQLAPVAMAFNGSADRRAPAGTSDIERKKTSEAPQQESVVGSFGPVPAPLRLTTAGLAPIITATKVDSFPDPDGDGRVSPGQTITYSVTINNTGPDPALNLTLNDTVDPNTTIVGGSAVSTPIAFDDAYNVVGNVRIQPNAAQGLLANDINPNTGNNSGLTASGPTTSTANGQVTINSDGSFSYNPPAGFTGTDTFTYTVTSANGTDTGSVTLTVGTAGAVIWFINATAPVGGDGRLTNPFNCYTGTSSGAQTCFSDTAADDPGDSIFLFSGNYTGGFNLANNQRLIGQGATDTLANIAGVTVPTSSDPLPATGGASPVITTTAAATIAIPLGSGNHLRGFTVGNTTGTKISGNGFGTLTVGNNTTPDVILNGSGRALGLVTGTFAATSGFASVATTSSTAQAILLTGLAGTVSFGSTTVSGATTQGIVVSTTTANINFGNTSVSGGTDGISLQNNSAGTRTFGTLGVSGGSGNAILHGAGGGNVTVGGAATLSSAGDAISVSAPTNGNLINFQAATSATRTAAGGNGVNWAGTAGATMTFNALTIQTNAGTGLNATVGGTINVTNGTGTINNTVQAAPAIVANGIALNANFSGINSSGGTSGVSLTNLTGTSNFGGGSLSGASGATFLVNGGTASTTFTGGVTQANNAAMVSVLGGHSGTLTFNTGTLGATNGAGLQFDNADGAYNFNGTTTLNGGDAGIDIQNGSGGTLVFSSNTSIDNPSGVAYREDTSTATVTYDGAITKTNNANNAVDINAKTGGATTFSGAISATTTTANAIDLTNTAGTVTFRGGMVVSTTSGIGFNATGSGATVNVCDENPCVPGSTGALVNTLTSTTGTALNVANTTIGANKLEFRSISSNGAANGIVLNATGATGSLTVSGNGGSCTSTATCTGGAIQNSTNAGISLTNTTSPSFTRIAIQNAARSGIDGQSVTNFTLANSFIDNVGTGAAGQHEESNIAFNDGGVFTSSSLSDTVSITNNTLTGARRHGIQIENGAGTISNLTISNNTLTSSMNAAVSLGTAILIVPQGSASTAANLTTGTISGNTINNFPSAEGIAVLGGIGSATNNTSTTLGANGTPISITGNFVNGGATRMGSNAIRVSFNGKFGVSNFNISNNGTVGSPLTNFQGLGISAFFGGTVTGTTTVNNNVIVSNQTIGAGSSGIAVQADDGPDGLGTADPDINVTINNNNVSANEGNGIRAIARATNRATMDLTIQNNTVTAPTLTNRNGIRVDSGSAAGDTSLCMLMAGNTSAGSGVNQGIGIRKQGTNAAVNVFGIIGLAPSPTTAANAAAKVAADNPAGSGVDVLSGDNFVNCTQTAPQPLGADVATRVVRSETGAPTPVQDGGDTLERLMKGSGDDASQQKEAVAGTPSTLASTTGATASVLPLLSSRAAEIIPANRTASTERNPFGLGITSKRDGGAVFNYAAAGTSAPLGQTQTRGSQDKQTQGGGGKSGAPSTPISTTQQTGAPTKPTVQTPVPGAVVVDPGVTYIPKPRPAIPPSGDGLPTPPVIVGDNLTWNVGTLPAGASVTITFQVVVDNPVAGGVTQVSNQGTVTADAIAAVLTDDPAVGGGADPTITGVTVPPNVFIRDARVAEPTAGTTSMLFTVALSTPATQLTTINYSTANGSAVEPGDYVAVVLGSTTFQIGEQLKVIPITVNADVDTMEVDEDFTVTISASPTVAIVVDATATGTITVANPAGTILISELRTSGPNGAGDDFVEIYNNTDTPLTVPAGGHGLFKRGADCNALPVLIGTIPAATVIPARGHYLFVGSTYSLSSYAAGDVTLTTDIESDFNVGLFSTVDPLAISTANRLDAVGFGVSTGGVCDLLLEGTTLAPASGSTSEYSFVRKFTLVGVNVPTPTDGNDNAADFALVSTTPSTPVGSNAAPGLGAPGPENLGGPNLKKFSQVGAQLIDPMVAQPEPPNLFRDTTPDPANNSTFGTIASRRGFINNTGGSITRLRFRIYDITTFPSPAGTADLRARTSGTVMVTVTGGSMVTVLGTTLETPPAQPNSGGLNSSLAAGTVTLGTPLANGASINLQFLFGVQQTGSFRVFVFVEAVP